MSLPVNTNPKFLAWYEAQRPSIRRAINSYWRDTASDSRLFRGHKSEEYARLTFLIEHCQSEYGYNA